MAKRKTEVVNKINFFERHKGVLKYVIPVLVGSLFFVGVWKISTLNSVQKDQPYNYVCEMVGADVELGMLAMKCMVK